MLLSKKGLDVTPIIYVDGEDENITKRIGDMIKFIRTIPEYREHLESLIFDEGMSLFIYVLNDDDPSYLFENIMAGISNSTVAWCTDIGSVIFIDYTAIYNLHKHHNNHCIKFSFDQILFEVLCHEVTHLFQDINKYEKSGDIEYMEKECDDFMYTTLFADEKRRRNPYMPEGSYFYDCFKEKIKNYVTGFEHPRSHIIMNPSLRNFFEMDDIVFEVDFSDSIVEIFSGCITPRFKFILCSLIVCVYAGSVVDLDIKDNKVVLVCADLTLFDIVDLVSILVNLSTRLDCPKHFSQIFMSNLLKVLPNIDLKIIADQLNVNYSHLFKIYDTKE